MLLALLTLIAQLPAAGDTAAPDVIYYGGKRVVFFAKTEAVVLLDSAWVKYGLMQVHSDSIHYDIKRHLLSAHGDVLFNSGSENVTGVLLRYDVDARKGLMRTARTRVENGFFRAGEVWLVRERVLNARGGSYTTCDHENPHYQFYGPRVKLFMDDIAIAEPVVFKFGRVPVLAAPFWLVPVASKRKSGLLPLKIGNSSTEGLYSKNMAYYWVINDYSDLTIYADLMTRKGLQTRLEGVYIVNPFANGSLTGSYIQEWDSGRRRYSLNAFHRSERFFFGTQLDAKADLMSDQSYVPDYSEERLDWLKQELSSYAEVTRRIGKVGTFSATARRYQDFAQRNRYYELPSARLSFGTRPLLGGWTVSPSASGSNRRDDYSDSLGADTARLATRRGSASLGFTSPQYSLGGLGSLTVTEALGLTESRNYSNETLSGRGRTVTSGLAVATDQKLAGSLNLTEQLALRQSDNLVDTVEPGAGYEASVAARLDLFRVFSTERLGMRGVLHKVTPSAGLSYVPRVDTGGIFGRPHFGTPASGTALRLGLSNTFQAKTDSLGTKLDLGSVDFASSYDLLGEKFQPLTGTVSFKPLQRSNLNLAVDASAAYDIESLALSRAYSVNTSFYWNRMRSDSLGERGLQLGLRHNVGSDAGGNSNHMVTATAAVAAWGWKVTLGEFGYNFARHELANYSVTVWRDLHCWEGTASFRKLGTEWKYDFEFHIKKLQDIKIGKSLFTPWLP